jgi:hypothetical protein
MAAVRQSTSSGFNGFSCRLTVLGESWREVVECRQRLVRSEAGMVGRNFRMTVRAAMSGCTPTPARGPPVHEDEQITMAW